MAFYRAKQIIVYIIVYKTVGSTAGAVITYKL